jgi:glycosyltransferase involved in cell wall biosynthesis
METMLSVLFVLPSAGASGGANSVVQECIALARMGVQAGVAVDRKNYDAFLENYPGSEHERLVAASYSAPDELAAAMRGADVVVATTNASVFHISEAMSSLTPGDRSGPRIAYYVQDYEPLFYALNSERWIAARRSYSEIPNAVLFAKTQWLRDTVYANHGIRVAKVEPSVDHTVFYPDFSRRSSRLCIAAMLRLSTARRAPRRTARIMESIAELTGCSVDLKVFGSDADRFAKSGLALDSAILNAGRLKRTEVGALLRTADLFLDLSDYQAFGRGGLEAMASGCVPLVPLLGGSREYAVHGKNAFVVDTRSDLAILEAVKVFLELDEGDRTDMRLSALATAARYTPEAAAVSELEVFWKMVRAHREQKTAEKRKEANKNP